MSEKKNDAEKVFAWIIPGGENQPFIPCGASGLTFGSNAKRNDVPLKRICAEPEQAELLWDRDSLYLRDLGCNGFTALNGAALYGDKKEELFHGDTLELAGESFRVYRCDKMPRPKPAFTVSFVCDGETVYTCECREGEEIKFPYMPFERLEGDEKKCFDCWTDQTGNRISDTSNLVCTGESQYSAEYTDFDPQGTCTAKGTFITDKTTYLATRIPKTGFRFGGSKQHECYLAGEIGICAEITEVDKGLVLEVLKENCVRLNGKYAKPAERFTLASSDIVEIGGRKYSAVNGNSKSVPEKQAFLRLDNGVEEELVGLTEGKSVFIGKLYQKSLSSIYFISRSHAVIRKKNGQYFIRDNNSRNGTLLKVAATGKELRLGHGEGAVSEARIENGDIIRFAQLMDATFILR